MAGLRAAANLAVLFSLLLAGCSSSSAGTTASPAPTPVAGCVSDDEQRTGGVRVPVDNGLPFDAVVLGNGTTGMVLANMNYGDLCQWKSTYADHLIGLGYRVIVFNYSAQGPAKDVVAAAGVLRGKGVQRLFLMGASMGGSAVLDAAAHLQPTVAGVISISAPRTYLGADAYNSMSILTAPALFIAAEYDQPFANDARALHEACTAKDKKLSIEPGGNHGTALLSDHVSTLIDTFFRDH
jgi:pimeloyl-ACP methyl ester carboxylesterase